MQRPFGILIWPRTVICWRSYSGVLRGLLKGITGQHPVCPRCCMILAGVILKTAGGTLDWLCSTRFSLGMWPLIQISLVSSSCGQQDQSKSQVQGNRDIFDWVTLLICSVSDWNQFSAVVVKQENPAAFKAQLASKFCACPMSHVILHEEICRLLCKKRQDKTRHPHVHLQSESAIPASAFPSQL